MSKINFLSILLITTLLSACGFHTPDKNNKNTSLNASVVSSKDNAFAVELKKRLNPVVAKSLVIEVADEVQKKQAASYDIRGEIRSYRLSVSVGVKIFDNNKKLLLADNFIDTAHLEREQATQADRLQIAEYYSRLRNALIERLLRKLNRL